MVFVDKFIFPILAAIATAVILTNPMKWDWQSRVAALIGVAAVAYLLAHQLNLRNDETRVGPGSTPTQTTQGSQSSSSAPSGAGSIVTSAPCSPVIVGSGNTVKADCEDVSKKAAPKNKK